MYGMPGRGPPGGRITRWRVMRSPSLVLKEHGLSTLRRRAPAGSALGVLAALAAAAMLAAPALTGSAQAATTPKYTVKIINNALDVELFGINDSGVIVGGGGDDGFVYQNGTATDLNTLIAPTTGLTLGPATGVNTKGQIAGSAILNSQEVGYVLTPVS
jgi:hypothetical protein